MTGIEILKPIESNLFGKKYEELSKSVVDNTFSIYMGREGTGQEFAMQVLAHETNRLCVAVDLDFIEKLKDINVSEALSLFADSATAQGKKIIFVIRRNKSIGNDTKKIQELIKIFDELIFNKLEAVVFYITDIADNKTNIQSLTIKDFIEPNEHPYGMLKEYTNASEKERMLIFMLCQCIKADDIDAVINTKLKHPTMVEDGLLIKIDNDDFKYKLSDKAKEKLYGFFGVAIKYF